MKKIVLVALTTLLVSPVFAQDLQEANRVTRYKQTKLDSNYKGEDAPTKSNKVLYRLTSYQMDENNLLSGEVEFEKELGVHGEEQEMYTVTTHILSFTDVEDESLQLYNHPTYGNIYIMASVEEKKVGLYRDSELTKSIVVFSPIQPKVKQTVVKTGEDKKNSEDHLSAFHRFTTIIPHTEGANK